MDNLTRPNSCRPQTSKPVLTRALMSEDYVDVQQWQKYIEQEIGFVLPDVQLQWLTNAITHTASLHGLSITKLWEQLPNNSAIRQRLLDKVLIHESRFFRHMPSVEFVIKCALEHQQLLIDSRTDGVSDELFRIWSVGCARGQEAWSLAMSLASEQLTNYSILGTDVSQQAIAKARLGRYDSRQQLLIPKRYQQFVRPLSASSTIGNLNPDDSTTIKIGTESQWQIAPVLQPYVDFVLHNVIEKQPPTSHLQHVIICQNMLLYFRKFDQRDILTRLSEQCVLGGYIILAPGEALFWRPSNMRRIAHPQVNVWQKTSA